MQLKESRRKIIEDLAQLIDDSLNEIYIFDQSTLRFIEVNASARANLGYTLDELKAMSPVDIKPDFDQETFAGLLVPLTTGQSNKIVLETRHQRRDGSTYPVEVHLQTGRFTGRAVYTAIILDITQRKEAEREREALNLKMQQGQKLESLGMLAGGIAHDFNNLLTSILGYSDLALSQVSEDSPAAAYIRAAIAGAQNAAELTHQLLAYSGHGQFLVEPLKLDVLVKDMARLLEVSVSKRCALRYESTLDDAPSIEGDASQIRQIVMNLIVNSADAIGEGSGTITLTTGATTLAEDDGSSYVGHQPLCGTYAFLQVEDTGDGMEAETVQRIFEPFFSTKLKGHGLGLAAVLGIVRRHKGALRVRSTLGRGTTIRVLFPVAKAVASLERSGNAVVSGPRCGIALVIDDEESVRHLAGAMLNAMGFEVRTARDGKEGVEIFEACQQDVALVLLDLVMPQLSGTEAFRLMREIRDGVPTILTSGYSEDSASDLVAACQQTDFIQKPYRYADLEDVVGRVMRAP